MSTIRTKIRRRQIGRVMLATRSDNAGVAYFGMSVPRRDRSGYPRIVARLDTFDRIATALLVIGPWALRVSDARLDLDGSQYGPLRITAGRREATA
jgi:hypothetical protein